ncbi:MAG TPA: hypothetical protein VGQ76_19720 [Thermoanaerobaculia bacterium]|jgi:uncharacterized protein YbaR (Trm112 family)|nr:hypothetical protein [Thermoanaerobaculia bacterium]
MIRITCTSCQKPLSLDETKLPMREVGFPCPVCKAKLTVDRRQFENPEAEVRRPAPVAQQAAQDDDDHSNDFGSKALILGADHPAIRQAAKLIGFLPVHHSDHAKGREFFNQEQPQVVFLHPVEMTQPPLDMGPIMSVVPSERRKSFFILIADNLRTLDGNAAFLYGVNLVVATKDLGQFPQIYREAQGAHDRLYSSMMGVLRERQL